MTETSILEIRDVVLDLGRKRILDHLSMQFWPGHVHAVVGPNGAGKSTLADTIMGLSGYTAFSGDILFEGESLKGLSIDQRARKGITLGWQEPARYEGLTVESFISAGAKNKSADYSARALERVGLEPDEYLERAVDRTLSGGERKRIEVASILTIEPKLVMMDEPDSGIDVDALRHGCHENQQTGNTVRLILVQHPWPMGKSEKHFHGLRTDNHQAGLRQEKLAEINHERTDHKTSRYGKLTNFFQETLC